MKHSKIPLIVGGLILAFAIILSVVSFVSGRSWVHKRESIAKAYIQKSKAALKEKDFQKAILYAKKAIKADPGYNEAFVCYEHAITSKYSKSQSRLRMPKPATGSVPTQTNGAAQQFGC